MADEQADIQESQTPDEKDTQENQESETVENATDSQTGGGDDEKQQQDYYAKELKRLQDVEAEKKKLEEELAEKERQVEIKNRALQAEKKKKPEVADRDALKDELLLEMRLERELSELPEAQRKVVLHHLQNSIRRTGDVKTDIQRAIAVSNAGRMSELLQQQQQADAADDAGVSSMLSGVQNGQRGTNRPQSAARKLAEQWAKEMKNPPKDLLKHIGNYLPN